MDDTQEKWKLITELSLLGDRYGDKLLSCMNRYGVYNTQDLTVDQLKEFLKEIKNEH